MRSAYYRSFLRNVVPFNALTTSSLLFSPCRCQFYHCSTHTMLAYMHATGVSDDGFILWKCWGLWFKIVGSLTLWLRGTKPQESISPASCCLDTVLHCLQGYFKPFKDIRVRVYVARMWTQPQRQLPMHVTSAPCWRSIPPVPHHPRWVRMMLRRDVFPRWPYSLCVSWAICSARWECELFNVKSPCSLKVVQLYSHWVKQEATLAQMQRGQRSSYQNRGGQKQRRESIFLASAVNICLLSFGIQLFLTCFSNYIVNMNWCLVGLLQELYVTVYLPSYLSLPLKLLLKKGNKCTI